MRDTGGVTINDIDISKATNKEVFWNFDRFGNSVQDPEEGSLFITYKVEGEIYFDVSRIYLDLDEIMPTYAYVFDVHTIKNYEPNGSLSNKIAYTSANDCYDAAIYWINENLEMLKGYYSKSVDEK